MRHERFYVIGDIHGSAIALRQVLLKCQFNLETDILIVLGDICDGYPDTFEVVEILKTIKNHILIKGNHDIQFINWLKTGAIPSHWQRMGGMSTVNSYMGKENYKKDHLEFILSTSKYYHISKTNLFVHAGINYKKPLDKNNKRTFTNNRSFWNIAKHYQNQKLKFTIKSDSKIKTIFIGHSPVNKNKKTLPEKRSNVWNIDTGAGNCGRLTIMEVKTKRYWQSDLTNTLYKS